MNVFHQLYSDLNVRLGIVGVESLKLKVDVKNVNKRQPAHQSNLPLL